FLDIEHRHIGVMHPMMGWRGIIGIRARRIRLPKIVQLLLDLWMRDKMNSTPIVGAVLVPTLDVVRNQGSSFQRNTIEKCFDFCRRRRSGWLAISNRADNFVTERAVAQRATDDGKENQ